MTAPEDLSSWIGRSWERKDVLDARLIAEFTATFAPHLANVGKVPPGIFWCLAPDIVGADQCGPDAHPRLGIFLPDAGLPRRMWAGGEIESLGDFEPGDVVTKQSVIADITRKTGKSGDLCFVTVQNVYSARGAVRLRERQDIVYRALPPSGSPPAGKLGPAIAAPAACWRIEASPTLLFRYSAMTFNGHRIHYDHPYATSVEGYAGLVVHGPLQATMMLNRLSQTMGHFPRRFGYRGLAPLIAGAAFHVTVKNEGSTQHASVVASDGTITMSGEAIG